MDVFLSEGPTGSCCLHVCEDGYPSLNVGQVPSTSPPLFPLKVTTFGASLVAQLVKNPPAMRETWVRSLG